MSNSNSTQTNESVPGQIVTVCAGEVRWRKDRLLEQLWRINHVGPTGVVVKTKEEWRLVPGDY